MLGVPRATAGRHRELEADTRSWRVLSCSVLVGGLDEAGPGPLNHEFFPGHGPLRSFPCGCRVRGPSLIAHLAVGCSVRPHDSVSPRCNSQGAGLNNPSQNWKDTCIP